MFFIYYLFIVYVHAMVCVWRSENNLQELVVSFYHIGLRDQTQVIWIPPNSFSHLTNFLTLYHLLILIHCLMLLIDFKIFYTYIDCSCLLSFIIFY